MQECLPARYRLLDLGFAVWGTVAFLIDLGSDMWSAVRYYRAGDTAWAVLFVGLYVLSSSVLQLLSWGWFWVDLQGWRLKEQDENPGNAGSGDEKQGTGGGDYRESYRPSDTSNGTKYLEDASHCTRVGTAVDAAPILKTAPALCDQRADLSPQDPGTAETPEEPPMGCCCCASHTAAGTEDEPIVSRFRTARIILWPSCFTLLHCLQLGYLLRCIHSLEVGIAAYRNPGEKQFKDYAYFLTHDISMMRLVETFLENTPQLILVLYIIIQREAIQPFQCFSISMSFICISWAILDYHQSLRLFLKEKQKLSNFSSAVYYAWNFCFISSRILCITLFTVTFHWMIALHFLLLWLAFFLWATLQQTTFMKHRFLEIVYRTTVAIILYFSWFNIADGRTFYRAIVYNVFIIIDSMILVVSWVQFKSPSILDGYETHIIVTNVVFFAVGLPLRLLYYKCLHPNVHAEKKEHFDVPDGINRAGTHKKLLSSGKNGVQPNDRMKYLAEQI